MARDRRRMSSLRRAAVRDLRLLLAADARRSEAAAAVLPGLWGSGRDQPHLTEAFHTPLLDVVPPTGFEPVVSTLKGWRPRPLDDGGSADAEPKAGRRSAITRARPNRTPGRRRRGRPVSRGRT